MITFDIIFFYFFIFLPRMTPETFIHRGDLVNEINRLGALYDIKDEFLDTPNVFMLCCSNKNERCDAKIVGLHCQKTKQYQIKRLDSMHSCSKNTKREQAIQHEISRMKPRPKRIGEVVEKLHTKFRAGYFEVFRASMKEEGPSFELFEKENITNSQEQQLFIKEGQMFEYTGRDSVISHKTDDSKHECLRALKEEFLELNPLMQCEFSRNNFFFKHKQMGEILRDVCELRILPMANGTLVLGLLFDPNDDFIVQSVLVSEESKTKALEIFIEYDTPTRLYIIDMDFELIEFLREAGHPFFIKSRSVFHYLHTDEDPLPAYFNELNYGDREFLDLPKEAYLRRFCPTPLYSLNNAHYPDFDFLSPYILSLPFVDCITSLMWSISDDIKGRKVIPGEDYDSRFPEFITGLFEEWEGKDGDVDLEAGTCECGKFQEFLFPCVHAYKKIRERGEDPLLYTSNIYNREIMQKIVDVVPVVNVKVHPFKTKTMPKKKRGEVESSCEKQ